jgi:hypothetical protein
MTAGADVPAAAEPPAAVVPTGATALPDAVVAAGAVVAAAAAFVGVAAAGEPNGFAPAAAVGAVVAAELLPALGVLVALLPPHAARIAAAAVPAIPPRKCRRETRVILLPDIVFPPA